jgi:hypothetical protein
MHYQIKNTYVKQSLTQKGDLTIMNNFKLLLSINKAMHQAIKVAATELGQTKTTFFRNSVLRNIKHYDRLESSTNTALNTINHSNRLQ